VQGCFLDDDHFKLERTEFAALVLGTRPDHFVPSRSAAAGERIAAGEMAAAYVVDGKPSPWLPVWQVEVRALTTLAQNLSSGAGRLRT